MRARTIAAALAAALLMAGCSAGSEQSAGGPETEPSTTSEAPATTTGPDTTAEPSTTTKQPIDLSAVISSGRPADGVVPDETWVPLIQEFDSFAADRDIGAAVLAVAVDGEPVLEVALGWSDLDRTMPLDTTDRFRLASVTKPYTRALALELEQQGRIDLDRPAFCTAARIDGCIIDVVDDAAAAGRPVLDELGAITVRHLIDHTGGFDSAVSLDPMFAPLLVQADLGLDRLPNERDVATWIAGEPLIHSPGQTYAYSNVGYLAAGLAIEEVVGQPYLDLLRSELGASERLTLGRSLPADRASDEVDYACDEGTTIDLFALDGPDTCWADGGFHLEAMTAHGRLVAPASEVLDFLVERCVDGLANTRTCDAWHDGSLSGTYTVARNIGRVDYVVLFNQRSDPAHAGFGYTEVVPTLDEAIANVVGDLFSN